jgi:predicted membrane protein
MGRVMILDLIYWVIRRDILFASQKSTKISSKCLAIPLHFTVSFVTEDVVYQIRCNVASEVEG